MLSFLIWYKTLLVTPVWSLALALFSGTMTELSARKDTFDDIALLLQVMMVNLLDRVD